MKVGDLIKLPIKNAGLPMIGMVMAVEAASVLADPRVMILQDWGEDWWSADYCEVINESR